MKRLLGVVLRLARRFRIRGARQRNLVVRGGVCVRLTAADLEVGQVARREFNEYIESQSDEVAFRAPVVGMVEAERTVRTLRLRGQVETVVSLVCGRCLRDYQQRLRIPLGEEFLLEPVASRAGGELGPDDFVLPLGPDQVLDASDVIRQHLLLATPMRPLCRAECAGLCPYCGADLNDGPCGCRGEAIDPRLAPLAKLKSKLDK